MKIGIEDNLLKALFQNVYFINGTAYAGKSTAVRMLAERYDGILCGENYHSALSRLADPEHQPNTCYFQTMSGWPEFLNRTPEEYAAWVDGGNEEIAELELLTLIRVAQEGKPVFVDTNISPSLLRRISDERHVAIMVAPGSVSVERFFDRSDPDKQFLFQEIGKCADPDATMANFRACIARLNSPERIAAFENCGFFVLHRDESRTPEQTVTLLARHFGLMEDNHDSQT